jgi:hypothetical protein
VPQLLSRFRESLHARVGITERFEVEQAVRRPEIVQDKIKAGATIVDGTS